MCTLRKYNFIKSMPIVVVFFFFFFLIQVETWMRGYEPRSPLAPDAASSSSSDASFASVVLWNTCPRAAAPLSTVHSADSTSPGDAGRTPESEHGTFLTRPESGFNVEWRRASVDVFLSFSTSGSGSSA